MKLQNAHNILSTNKDNIINKWLEYESLNDILKNIQHEKETYKKDVATPILEYFLNIIIEKKEIGDCPVMRKLVETFLDSGLCVEDVFLNCTTLKNIIVETLYDNELNKDEINKIIAILDKNLTRILGIYTKEKSENDLKSIFHSKLIEEHVALSITDTNGFITYVTDAFSKLSGYSEDELLGNTHSIIRHPDMKDEFFKSMWLKLKKNHTWKGKIKNKKKDGGEFIAKTEIIPFINENGKVSEYVSIRHDITDKELSNVDTLTSMYNRRYYKNIIDNIFETYQKISFMVLDIDHFKKINDTYGHSFGDFVLKEFAKVVSKKIRQEDICIRWGGEEFLVILPNTKLDKATEIAERIRVTIERLVVLDETSKTSVDIKCSIGVTGREANESYSVMFDKADGNLYSAKNAGRNIVVSK